MSDDHASHAISAYGSVVNKTPNIDRIAHEGMRLDSVYCTNSICSPSRATILTGTYSHINGVSSIWTEIDHRIPSFSEILKGEGYRTAIFGKWHLGEKAHSQPKGFDTWKVFPGQGDYLNPEMLSESGSEVVEGYATDIVTDLALDWLGELEGTEPFCLLVHHKAPHRPWVPDEKHQHLYSDGNIPEPETFFDDNASRSKAVQGVHMTIADDMGAEDIKTEVPVELRGPENREARMRWKYQIYMRDYLQCVQSIDDNVGRLLDYLDESGRAQDTMVVYTSDQGFFLGDHGWFDKRLMYDQSLQMPMLIRLPGVIKPGSVSDKIITNVDFAATFLEVCGLNAQEELPRNQGTSFFQILEGKDVPDWQDAAYYRYWEHDDPIHAAPAHYGIRTDKYKLIYFYGAGLNVPGASEKIYEPEWELYDLENDFQELNNVVNDPAYSEVFTAMKSKLSEYQAKFEDHPYTGPSTPVPDWAPHDAELLVRVEQYVKNIRESSS